MGAQLREPFNQQITHLHEAQVRHPGAVAALHGGRHVCNSPYPMGREMVTALHLPRGCTLLKASVLPCLGLGEGLCACMLLGQVI